MYKVKSLNPPDFEPLNSIFSGSLIFDNCNLLGIDAELSDDADMCEFKLKEVIALTFEQLGINKNLPKTYGDHNDFMQLTRIDWNYLKNNPSKN